MQSSGTCSKRPTTVPGEVLHGTLTLCAQNLPCQTTSTRASKALQPDTQMHQKTASSSTPQQPPPRPPPSTNQQSLLHRKSTMHSRTIPRVFLLHFPRTQITPCRPLEVPGATGLLGLRRRGRRRSHCGQCRGPQMGRAVEVR